MATTRPCRSWLRAKRSRGASGPMYATTGRLGDAHRRRRSITLRAIAGTNIPSGILRGFAGILQADAYAGYNELYDPARRQGPIIAALCWAHARRKFFELADIATERSAREACVRDLADGAGGGQSASTRSVRHRARHQWLISAEQRLPCAGEQSRAAVMA